MASSVPIGKTALFLMPRFSRHAGRRSWERLEAFYNPENVFAEVILVSLGEDAPDLPERIGSLRIVPLGALRPRPHWMALGQRLYAWRDEVAGAILQLARDFAADILVQRYGSPRWHGLPIVAAARRLGLPSVITFQNVYEHDVTSRFGVAGRVLDRALQIPQWRFLLRQSSAIWTVSRFLCSRVAAFGIPPSKIVAIPNKDTLEKFTAPPPAAASAGVLARVGLGALERQHPLLLCVGRLVEQKNYPVILSAFARVVRRHPETVLLVVGEGPKERELRASIASLGLENRVFLHGEYLSQRDLAALYHRSTALVFCSLYEGQGRVVYEAMACGTPVIGSEIGPIPEMVVDGETGLLVDPTSTGAVAEAMSRFCSGRCSRADMAAACRRTAAQFALETVNRLEAAFYRRLMTGEPANPLR